jgi:phenylpropionate dioxygenase-like ring-hydroxylating dioxygenase large terminal subunit
VTAVAAPPSCYLDDVQVIERLLAHIAAGTTDEGPRTGRVPIEHYVEPDRLGREIALLRRRPVPFCPSVSLPQPGSYHARDAAGVPIVAVRDNHGRVHAYRNSCRHRGTPVVEGSGCARALVCPFHGWVYALNGSLSHIPHADGFPGLDPATRGLIPVACQERAGVIWVNQDADDFESVATLPGLIPNQILVEHVSMTVACNWKVLAEGFLEGYHIRATHPTTFLPFGYDNLTVLEQSGPHNRITFPFRRIETLRERPRDSWSIDGMITQLDHVFPNAVIVRLTSHTAVIAIEPIDVGHGRLEIYKLATAAQDGSVPESAHRDIAFVEAGLREDRAMAEGVQHGLTGRSDDVVFARYESALTHLHEELAAALR